MSLAGLLHEADAFREGEFTLSSGRTSNYYVDVKRACTDPSVLRALAQNGRTYAIGKDAIAGTALGGVPLAVAMGLDTGLDTLLVRSTSKDHGTGSRIEGPVHEGDEVLVVEDVTTTGQSLLESVQALRAAGLEVRHALTIVDREEGARDLLDDNDVTLHALVTLSELTETTGVEP